MTRLQARSEARAGNVKNIEFGPFTMVKQAEHWGFDEFGFLVLWDLDHSDPSRLAYV